VVKWCPSEGNVLRGFLGALKSKQPAIPLKVCGGARLWWRKG
jgi:hypothetical protein